MAFHITMKFESGVHSCTWHIGGMKPSKNNSETIIAIQADGHELEFLKANFSMIPFVANRRIVIWRGEMAEFIYDNL